jgi:hypothetical protein
VFKCSTPQLPPDPRRAWLPGERKACLSVVPRDVNGTIGIFFRAVALALDPTLKDQRATYLDASTGPVAQPQPLPASGARRHNKAPSAPDTVA